MLGRRRQGGQPELKVLFITGCAENAVVGKAVSGSSLRRRTDDIRQGLDVKVTSYGLFWRENEIEWAPGKGNRKTFRLLGRLGANRGTLQMADFRHQQGIYILYDEYGPSYVGLTRGQGLGKRLKDHRADHLAKKWDRFSWFGFRELGAVGADGILALFDLPGEGELSDDTHTTIGDLEALLIKAIGPKRNTASMSFNNAREWTQVRWDEIATYLSRLTPGSA